jgi:trehalose 6-phosphate phosphatase
MTGGVTAISGAELAREVSVAASNPGAARTLLLDVDGTLAPIAPTPDQAAVPVATRASIERLAEAGWQVVLVSGRPVAEIRSMVPAEGVVAFGSHGLEGGFGGSDTAETRLPADLAERLDVLEAQAASLARKSPGARIERKPAGLAFHDRLVPDDRLRAWRERLSAWLDGIPLEGFDRLEGKRVLEIRPVGFDKGRVVRIVVERLGVSGPDRSLVAIGDDVTDEDMFTQIRGVGLAVLVGEANRVTSATHSVESTEEVGRFLSALVDGVGRDR